jgi:hypothetical protein
VATRQRIATVEVFPLTTARGEAACSPFQGEPKWGTAGDDLSAGIGVQDKLAKELS